MSNNNMINSIHDDDTIAQFINEEIMRQNENYMRSITQFETLQRISQRRRHEIMARRSIIVPNLKKQILTPYESEEEFECPLTLKLHKNGYILPCKHIFSDEILKWNKKTCPCCRAKY